MSRYLWLICEAALVAVAAVMTVLSGTTLSGLILAVMTVVCAAAVWFGLRPLRLYLNAFRTAAGKITKVTELKSGRPWEQIEKMNDFFEHPELDRLFGEYVQEVQQQRRHGLGLNDVSKVMDEDSLYVRTWQGVLQQVPGTLLGLGILGTFLGLFSGLEGLRFEDATMMIISIEKLLGSMGTAFYTAIAGVVLSILFNILNRIEWNVAVRELSFFTEEFYRYIIPSEEEQSRIRSKHEVAAILQKLDNLQG